MTGGSSPSWPAVIRALFLYLFVSWLLIRYAAGEQTGTSAGAVYYVILAGFPVAAILAAWLRGVPGGQGLGVWRGPVMAVICASALPLVCIKSFVAGPEPEEIVLTPAQARPAVITDTQISDPAEGLRLRIRGLSVTSNEPGIDSAGHRPAEILLLTSVDHGVSGDELVVLVQLLASEDGAEIWRGEYRGDPSDLAEIRRLLIRALTEAMSLTKEGLSGGQIV